MGNASETPLSLSAAFDEASEADWLDGVTKALKGRDIKTLSRRTYDEISIKPLYRESDAASAADPLGGPGAAPYLRGASAAPDKFLPWDIRQCFTHPDPATTNTEILRDLERGVSSIELKHDCTGAHGIQLCDSGDFETALKGVRPDIATIALDHGRGSGASNAALLAKWASTQDEAADAQLAFNVDPLCALARVGLIEAGLDASFAKLAALFSKLADTFPKSTLLRSDARFIHEAGGSEAMELAALIASAVDTMRRLDAAGISPSDSSTQFVFTLSLDANYGMGVAKLRAARRLWARILDAMKIDAQPMRLQGYTSGRMLTRHDTWTNMLRGTAACFAGAIGGADIVTVRAFNEPLGTPEELGRRVARNTQIIAMEESQLGRVADPTGGAWFTETLANELAEAAWLEFQQIESEGGYGASLMADKFQARVAEIRAARMKNIAKRKDPITGVSEFPLLDGVDAPVAEPISVTPKDGVSDEGLKHFLPDFVPANSDASEAEPFWPIRLSEPYERLRDIADARTETSGKRPSVFLATLGPLAEHTARADFASNLFATGGIEAVEAPVPPKDIPELAAAFKASGCALAVICGTDKRYGDEAAQAAAALKDANCQRVYLAGKGDFDGIDSNIFAGCDVIHILELTHAELGLA